VAKDGDVVHLEATGTASFEENRPMKRDTIFGIASMTKPITATALFMLQDEGKLSVKDPVSKYIPEFGTLRVKDSAQETKPVTIKDIMTHTAGLGRPPRFNASRENSEPSLKDYARLIAEKPLNFHPGTKWSYSSGLTVCGLIIEIVSGLAYEDFLKQRIFEPLGMTDTTFHLTEAHRKRLAQLYTLDDGKLIPDQHPMIPKDPSIKRTPNPSGGLFSTASDIGRFYNMILNGGELDGVRIVSARAAQVMTTTQTGNLKTGFTPGNGWGLGWCVVNEPQGVTGMLSPGTFGHGGSKGTQGWVDPARKMVFVLMIQRSGLDNSDASEMRRVFQQVAVDALGQ